MLNLLAELNVGSFSTDYQAARKQFLTTYQCLDAKLRKKHSFYTHPLKGALGETLECDVVYLGLSEKPEQILVLMSATHGVEGFAGSAIQVDVLPLLETLLQRQPSLGIIIIHAFNPWGFSWLRRYDHEGVDLNRNFIDFNKSLPQNLSYDRIHSALLKIEKFGQDELQQFWQLENLTDFTEIMTHGQFTHPDGCFYGGEKQSWSRQVLEEISTDPVLQNAKAIAVIDLHTGLGPYGYGEVINDHTPGTVGFQLANDWYGSNAQSALLGESCSTVKLGLVDYHWHQLMGDRGCFVTLEFGTYSIQQLWISLLNEQRYHNSIEANGELRSLANSNVQQLKSLFYPTEKSWQQQVLFRGRQVISLALEGLIR